MNNQERIAGLKACQYQELFGVTKELFEKMLKILQDKFHELHRRGGHPPKLSVLDKLIITLGYYREYRGMKHIAFDYAVSKSTISESIQWVEKTLISSGQLNLPRKRKLPQDAQPETVLIDATECEIERPKKNSAGFTRARKRDTH